MKCFLDYSAVQSCLTFLYMDLDRAEFSTVFAKKISFCWLVSWLKYEQINACQDQQPIQQ